MENMASTNFSTIIYPLAMVSVFSNIWSLLLEGRGDTTRLVAAFSAGFCAEAGASLPV